MRATVNDTYSIPLGLGMLLLVWDETGGWAVQAPATMDHLAAKCVSLDAFAA